MSLRDEILAAPDLKRVLVEVPEWPGKDLYLQELCVNDAEALREIAEGKDQKLFRIQLVIKTLFNGKGEPVFRESDAEALGKKSNAVITRLSDKAIDLLSLSSEAVDAAEKNSESTPPKP